MKSDLEIEKDVCAELDWVSALKKSEIGVSVSDGIATITGVIDSYHKKRIAKNTVLRIAGVRAVADDLLVRIEDQNKRTDTQIAKAAINALNWQSEIHADKIKIFVEDGWVTLEGSAENLLQKKMAKSTLEKLQGVRGVSNLILVKVAEEMKETKSAILASFQRNGVINSKNIMVQELGDRVVLSGIAHSFAEKNDAERIALNATGISQVDNRIEVSTSDLVPT
jgi:osmotically-inducible protein OsmY